MRERASNRPSPRRARSVAAGRWNAAHAQDVKRSPVSPSFQRPVSTARNVNSAHHWNTGLETAVAPWTHNTRRAPKTGPVLKCHRLTSKMVTPTVQFSFVYLPVIRLPE
jgi:hypothetical protein